MGRLVWQAWDTMARISSVQKGGRCATMARVHPRHPDT